MASISCQVGPGSPDPSTRRPKVAIPVGSMKNQCPGCGELFGGVRTFDLHRYGPFTARKCLTAAELAAKGWRHDAAGFWSRPFATAKLDLEGAD